MRTQVPPLAQLLADYSSAPAAPLTGVPGIDPHKPRTGSFSLVLQRAQEAPPGNILNRAGQPVVLDHPTDVQVLHSNKPIATNKLQRHLMMLLAPQIGDTSVCSRQPLDFLSSVPAALPLPANRPLLSSQLWQLGLKKARVLNVLAIRGGQEVLKANINPDRRINARRNLNLAKVTRKNRIPAVSLALNTNGLNLAFDFSVHFNFNQTNRLDTQLAIRQLNTVAVRRKFYGRKIPLAFKPWVARLFAALDTMEERLKRLIQATERGLATAKVQLGKLRAFGAQPLEFGGLSAIVDALVVSLPRSLTPAQGVVIKASMQVEREGEAVSLVAVRIKQKFESSPHASLILLIFNVLYNGRLTNAPDCSGVVAARPESWQSGAQARELFAQNMRSVTFEPVDNLGHAKNRIGLDKQMHVVGANAHPVDFYFKLRRLLPQKLFETRLHLSPENIPAVLRAPHDVVLERVDGAAISSVSRFHALDYISAKDIVNTIPAKKRSEASAVA